MEWTIERLTGFLRSCNIDPDGYGNRIGETVEEMTQRLSGGRFTTYEIAEWERSVEREAGI